MDFVVLSKNLTTVIYLLLQNLDAVQAYILVERWRKNSKQQATEENCVYNVHRLTASQVEAVAETFRLERVCILKCIEDLLWLGEGLVQEGTLKETIEHTLSGMVESNPGLEMNMFTALKESLEGDMPLRSQAWLVPSGGAAADYRATEQNIMLTILALLYFHPRKQCTPERFLNLAQLFNSRLFSMYAVPPGAFGQEISNTTAFDKHPAALTTKLANLLLLEVLMLDIHKPMAALADNCNISADDCPFLAPGIVNKVDEELRYWWENATLAHAPVLLAWSSLLCIGSSCVGASENVTG